MPATMKWKLQFFDRPAVSRRVDPIMRQALSRAGALIRRDARRSMRRRGKTARAQHSKPGNPPKVDSGELKKLLFFAWDPRTESVVVGPVGFRGSTVPETLEFGGREKVSFRDRKSGRRRTRQVSIAARPYMRPAFEKNRGEIPRALRNASGTGRL